VKYVYVYVYTCNFHFIFILFFDWQTSSLIPTSDVTSIRAEKGLVTVDGIANGDANVRAGPLPPADPTTGGWTVHAYLDHAIVELIVNKATAFVVYGAPAVDATTVEMTGGTALEVWTLKSANNQ
jgi:hypothetical protein